MCSVNATERLNELLASVSTAAANIVEQAKTDGGEIIPPSSSSPSSFSSFPVKESSKWILFWRRWHLSVYRRRQTAALLFATAHLRRGNQDNSSPSLAFRVSDPLLESHAGLPPSNEQRSESNVGPAQWRWFCSGWFATQEASFMSQSVALLTLIPFIMPTLLWKLTQKRTF